MDSTNGRCRESVERTAGSASGIQEEMEMEMGVVGMESESESEDEGDVRGRARRKWVGEELDSEGDEV